MVACSKTFPARPIMGNSAVQGTFEEGIVTENLASFPDNSSIGQSSAFLIGRPPPPAKRVGDEPSNAAKRKQYYTN